VIPPLKPNHSRPDIPSSYPVIDINQHFDSVMQAGPGNYSNQPRGNENDENNGSISSTNNWSSNRMRTGPSNISHGHGGHSTSDISNNSRLFSMANDTTNVTSFESLGDGVDQRDNNQEHAPARSMPFANETAEHNCKCPNGCLEQVA